jgi:AcrR family transcriptional regulator
VLAAAEKLFAQHGVANVSMDAVAAEAGVGKGTLFRRFTDRAGLAIALLDERERDLQQALLTGPPPLGPGAPPGERLTAFCDAYLAFLTAQVELLLASEMASVGSRYRVGTYRFWHRHIALLLGQARPDLDAEYLAHAILAPLGADVYQALREQFGLPRDRIAAGLRALLEPLLATPGAAGQVRR